MCVSALRHTLTHSHPARIHIYNKQQRVLGNTQRSQRAHYASSPDWTGLCPDDDQVPMEPGMHSHTHTATRPHNALTLARTDYQCKCNGNNDQYQCKWPCTLPKAHTDRTERYPIPSSNKNPVFGLIGQLDQT